MMEKLFLQVLATAAVSAVLLLVLLFPARRWLEDRYGAQTRYLVWLGLAAVLLLAPLLPRPMAPVQVEIPAYAVPLTRPTQAVESVQSPAVTPSLPAATQPVTQAGTSQVTGPVNTASADPQPSAPSIVWTELLSRLWLAVAGLLLAVQTACCLLTRRKLMRASAPLDGAGKAQLRTLPCLNTPMTLGLLRPVVFLPEGEVSPLAVEHELTHIKRGDLWGKAFLFLTCALYWFDPLVWYMARVAVGDIEAACDAQVTAGFSDADKRRYGELLLSAASGCKAAPLSTRFGGSKEQMKARLAQLFRSGKRSRALVALLVTAALALTSLVACQSGEEDLPTLAQPSAAPTSTPRVAAGAEELEEAALDYFALKRDAVNGVALPPEAADSPLGQELTARAQAMRAHYAEWGIYIVSIETEYKDFMVRWVQGDTAMVSLYEWTWVNYNNGQGGEATDRMGWGYPHDVTLTRGDSGYAVTRDMSDEFEETNYQSEFFPGSDKYDWDCLEGDVYTYESDDIGIWLAFPPEWKDYFTFEERVMTDAFLQSGQPCPVIELVPTLARNGDPTLDATLARIFWLPKGDAVAGGDGKVLMTLMALDEGTYVCEVNIALQSALGPEDGELKAICETVQNGILDLRWWSYEILRSD